VNASIAYFTDANYTDAELDKVILEGYILARFDKNTLFQGGSISLDDTPILILVDKKAKEYVVIQEGIANEGVGIAFAWSGAPIFNGLDKNGKDTGKDYIRAYLSAKVDDPNSGDNFFELIARDGVTNISPAVIDGTKTKISIPKRINFDDREVSSETNLMSGYETAVSMVHDTKYTKLANIAKLKVSDAADLIEADLIKKGFERLTAAQFFTE
jgi:hypothetical protein